MWGYKVLLICAEESYICPDLPIISLLGSLIQAMVAKAENRFSNVKINLQLSLSSVWVMLVFLMEVFVTLREIPNTGYLFVTCVKYLVVVALTPMIVGKFLL